MEIKNIEVNIGVHYETTYVHGVPHCTSSNRNFFINEEKYEKILKILEEEHE